MSLPLCARVDETDERSAEALVADGWRPIEILETWYSNVAYPMAETHDFDIRRLRSSDRVACHFILGQNNYPLSRLFTDPNVPFVLADSTRGAWLRSVFDNDYLCLVADEDDVMAFITCYPYRGANRIGFLAVLNQYQGRGIAKALVRDLIRRVKTDMYAGTQAHNESARGLYASLGFECIGRQTTFHKSVAA